MFYNVLIEGEGNRKRMENHGKGMCALTNTCTYFADKRSQKMTEIVLVQIVLPGMWLLRMV